MLHLPENDCDSDAHSTAKYFAGLGIVCCSIGIPILYLLILSRHTTDLSDGNDDTSRNTKGWGHVSQSGTAAAPGALADADTRLLV